MIPVLVVAGVLAAVGVGAWLATSREPGPTAAQQARAAAAGATPAIDVELRVLPSAGWTAVADDLAIMRTILEHRVVALSVGSPTVSVSGTDRLVIHIPGNQDTTAIRKVIAATGRFDVQHLTPPAPERGTFIDVTEERYLFGGDQFRDAVVEQGSADPALRLALSVKEDGKALLAAWASEHPDEVLAVTLDGVIIGVTDASGLRDSTLSLESSGSRVEADDLMVLLDYGQLPFPVEEIGVQESGASG